VLTGPEVATAGRPRAFLPDVRRLSWPAAVAAGVVVLFCYALRVAGAFMAQSDGAGNVLQAWAMLHGNLLLHGWYVSDVSFYTTELPEYMLVAAAYGLRPEVVHICAALTYTLLVLAAAVVARGQARGRAGVARAAIAVAIMLGPALATWPRVVPAFLVLAQRRVPVAAAGYELSLTAAAVAAAIAGEAMTHLIRALGGYRVNPAPAHIVPFRDIPANIEGAFKAFLDLFSADFFGERGGPGLVITSIHLVAVVLVAAAVVAGLLRFFRGDDLLSPLLAVAVVLNVAAYVLLYSVSWEEILGDRPGLRARRRAGRPAARRAAAAPAADTASRGRGGSGGVGGRAALGVCRARGTRRGQPGAVAGAPRPASGHRRLLAGQQRDRGQQRPGDDARGQPRLRGGGGPRAVPLGKRRDGGRRIYCPTSHITPELPPSHRHYP
jgi:hypothetical protein